MRPPDGKDRNPEFRARTSQRCVKRKEQFNQRTLTFLELRCIHPEISDAAVAILLVGGSECTS